MIRNHCRGKSLTKWMWMILTVKREGEKSCNMLGPRFWSVSPQSQLKVAGVIESESGYCVKWHAPEFPSNSFARPLAHEACCCYCCWWWWWRCHLDVGRHVWAQGSIKSNQWSSSACLLFCETVIAMIIFNKPGIVMIIMKVLKFKIKKKHILSVHKPYILHVSEIMIVRSTLNTGSVWEGQIVKLLKPKGNNNHDNWPMTRSQEWWRSWRYGETQLWEVGDE